jgi:hypothetical protein
MYVHTPPGGWLEGPFVARAKAHVAQARANALLVGALGEGHRRTLTYLNVCAHASACVRNAGTSQKLCHVRCIKLLGSAQKPQVSLAPTHGGRKAEETAKTVTFTVVAQKKEI